MSATTERTGATTHISVSDRAGNVVSYTFTIESISGAGLVVSGYGFLLNHELTDFNFDSLTHPNRARANQRPRSSISPTIVMRDGKPWLTVGHSRRLDDHHDGPAAAGRPHRPPT